MLCVKVPATTANMGPGFDCIGMALKLYNNTWFEVLDDGRLEIESRNKFDVPLDKSNLIYESFANFYKEAGIAHVPGLRIIQEDNIPMTRGLGSSAACIVAGLLAANELSGVRMSRQDLAFLSAKIEGHPDNTVPAFLGGLIIGVLTDEKLEYAKIDESYLDKLSFAVMVPDFQLSTTMARDILPEQYPARDSIFNTSRAALMVAALMTGDFDRLDVAMDDRIHQPYRSKIIPGMDGIFAEARRLGAKGIFLSGAGPTIISVVKRTDNADTYRAGMENHLKALPDKWDFNFIEPDYSGAVLTTGRD